MYLNELPLEFNYDFIGINAGMFEAKPPFCPQPAPIKICLAGTVIHACVEEKRRAIELLMSCYMKHATLPSYLSKKQSESVIRLQITSLWNQIN